MRHSGYLTHLASLTLVAAKKVPIPLPTPPDTNILDKFKPFLLMDHHLWYLCIFGYCLSVCILARKANPGIDWYKGAVLTVLMGYGGGMTVPILLGIPGVLVQNEVAIPMMVFTWMLASSSIINSGMDALRTAAPALAFFGVVLLSIAFEIFRCQVMMGCAAMAIANLKPPASYPVATVGPLLCGLLGGTVGGFMPLSVGLEPLSKGLNWRVRSAFFFSIWMRLLLDPTTSPYLVDMMPGLADTAAGRAFGVAVVAALPLVDIVSGRRLAGPNPLVDLANDQFKSKRE
uniref:Uncharacterized protein n=1 Tax=Haptolina brevifila TaxID=156173 RepID=A0A7S2MZU3_9EUKA|mmetsp:Transcript_62866/g.124132  ORF Transcript_62866/g.124132 Transcript_62866/m.124132 type:complete len:288 (+) Transcript_62866:78-941(+)|eukprot:CAMPEP_0174703014 /NCGR_PEP_ID=MMETSP1094-20130205/7111_1 /TAXON_ID=156173 /ORGANISM="Chrysochromulina brevifilum, Strain UTEX LB 985" /LENGTH=287 /DNA_ID=CAMNT_0015900877 /DNA_START=70 /DNA_END=933 /DNA_ORIENTATION=+